MRRINMLHLKRLMLEQAVTNGLKITLMSDDEFIAEDEHVIIFVNLDIVLEMIQNGWTVDRIFENETNLKKVS